MEIIFGTLLIQGLSSFLEPGNAWLLMSGFPDPNQAGAAATNFIVNVKHLASNTPVAVTGTRNAIGTQPVITMTDINAAGTLMEHAMATPEFKARMATSEKGKRAERASKPNSGPGRRSRAAKSSSDKK